MFDQTMTASSLSFSVPTLANSVQYAASNPDASQPGTPSDIGRIETDPAGPEVAARRNGETTPGQLYLKEARSRFRYYQYLTVQAIQQVDDEGFFYARGKDSNSIAIIVKHLIGNMRSRFTDFLTSDGEKPDRNRDDEFERFVRDTRERLEIALEHAWELVIDTVDEITEEMLTETVYIRSQPLSVLEAINRQLTHYSYHVGQIVYLAKQACGDDWKSLSIPKGRSDEFNREMMR
ncbi:MAG: DUF1572 family protein [Rhodothermales bacterium]